MPEREPLWSGDEDERPTRVTSGAQAATPSPPADPERPANGNGSAREALAARLAAAAPGSGYDATERVGRRRSRVTTAAAALMAAAAIAAGAVVLPGAFDGSPSETKPAAAPLSASPGTVGPSRVGQVYEAAGRSVVQVRTTGGSGTGFLIDRHGTFVTNAHVVGSARSVRLRLDGVQRLVDGTVVGTDESSDLAVVEVDPADVANLRPLPLADSDKIKVGDTAIAIGYPLGLDRTVTAGIVSGTGRKIEAPNGFSIDKVIQTDAPINPGNSGGPLLDSNGRVIGVNSQIATAGSQGNVGIGFAVPSNTVRSVVPVLRSGGAVVRPFLGVTTGESLSGPLGAVVRDVTRGGPSDRAGLKPGASPSGADGDVIVGIDGKRVAGPDDVATAIEGHKPGDRVSVDVVRNGSRKTLEVQLGRRPEGAGP
jgi:putative serine protease PepD